MGDSFENRSNRQAHPGLRGYCKQCRACIYENCLPGYDSELVCWSCRLPNPRQPPLLYRLRWARYSLRRWVQVRGWHVETQIKTPLDLFLLSRERKYRRRATVRNAQVQRMRHIEQGWRRHGQV